MWANYSKFAQQACMRNISIIQTQCQQNNDTHKNKKESVTDDSRRSKSLSESIHAKWTSSP